MIETRKMLYPHVFLYHLPLSIIYPSFIYGSISVSIHLISHTRAQSAGAKKSLKIKGTIIFWTKQVLSDQ